MEELSCIIQEWRGEGREGEGEGRGGSGGTIMYNTGVEGGGEGGGGAVEEQANYHV